MFIKFFKPIAILFLLFYQVPLYAKISDSNYFNPKALAEYFSALISYDNRESSKSLEFFNRSKILINRHDPYLRKYIFLLIEEGKINKAINELKNNLNKENSDFFESYLFWLKLS